MQSRIGLCVLLLLATVVCVAPVATTPASGQTGLVAQQTAVNADDVRITVTLDENGTAEWDLAFRRVLATDGEQAAFDSLRNDIAANPTAYTDPFAERIRRTVATAENTTSRSMAAKAFSIDTETQSLGREYGIVTYRFTWTNFAAMTDGELRAGDAIDGFFLDDQTRLRVQWPDSYRIDSAAPDADETPDNAVVWDGDKTDFVTGEPRIVVITGGGGLTPGMVIGVIIVILLAGVGGWFYQRRPGGSDNQPAAAAGDGDTRIEAEISHTDSTAGTAAAGDTVDDEPASELLSNEERVLQLLDERGGRMKQQQVIEEFGWTDAKTSKVVSGLREDGSINSFRIGRENVLTYPDEKLTGGNDDASGE